MGKTKFELAIDFIKSSIIDSEWAHKVYLVGGCVRDELMGLPIKDIDLMVDYQDGGLKFAEWMTTTFPNTCKNLVLYPRFGTSKFSIIVNNETVDIECVMPRGETYEEGSRKPIDVKYVSLKEDALRRDFTVNALYKDIIDNKVIDPLNRGINDIKNNILNTTSCPEDIFEEDPLRMLRAVRFYCCKHFDLTDNLISGIEYSARYLHKISVERINDEFSKILCSDRPIDGINLLVETGLMTFIIPEICDTCGFNQYSKYHDKDVYEHTLNVVNLTKPILAHRLAALLHDIAKPYYHQDIYEDGKIVKRKFIGHDIKSAEYAEKILKKLRYSNDIIDEVCFAIKHHMILKEFDANNTKESTCRRIYRNIFKYYDTTLDLIDADNKSHASLYNKPNQVSEFVKYAKIIGIKPEKRKLPINGNDIIEYFNIKPGPLVKKILDDAENVYDDYPNIDKSNMLEKLDYRFNIEKIDITNWMTGKVIFSYACENNTITKTLEEAVKQGVSLAYADLRGEKIICANLKGANLSYARLDSCLIHDCNLSDSTLIDTSFYDTKIIDTKLDNSYGGKNFSLDLRYSNYFLDGNGFLKLE